jgi:GNAT superfamily N-acetyltransferase
VSVRPAVAGDVAEIARVQVSTWSTAYGSLLPGGVLAAATEQRAAAEWAAAVGSPPSPEHRVLVALEGPQLVGFAAFGPAEPGAAEIYTLLVEPRWGRRGHGSRLLAATVDLVRPARVETLVAWVLDGDTASAGFYSGAGWAPDGSVRSLVGDDRTVREARWHVSLLESLSGRDGEGER